MDGIGLYLQNWGSLGIWPEVYQFCIPVSENGFLGKQITFSASTCERIKLGGDFCLMQKAGTSIKLDAFPLWRSSVWVDLTAQISHAIFLCYKMNPPWKII